MGNIFLCSSCNRKIFPFGFLKKIPRIFQRLYFLICLSFSWPLFRADNIQQAIGMAKTMLKMNITPEGLAQTNMYLHQYGLYIVLGMIFSMPIYRVVKQKLLENASEKKQILITGVNYLLLLVVFFVSLLYLVNSSYNPFIYFRF